MSSLAPALLLSMPQLLDPNFARAVVLLCKHNDDGAFGLVLNRPLVTTGMVMVQLDPPVATDRELDIWIGGPVEPQRSWILVGGRPEQPEVYGASEIAESVYLSTSPDLLRRLLEPQPPANARLVVGYAGWAPGQLETEIHSNGWLHCSADPELIFGTDVGAKYDRAMQKIGIRPGMLSSDVGHA